MYFASVKEALGGSSFDVYNVAQGSNLKDLLELILSKHSENLLLKSILDTAMVAVNDEYVFEPAKTAFKGNEEVAIIPPISGG